MARDRAKENLISAVGAVQINPIRLGTNLSLIMIEMSALALYVLTSVASNEPHSSGNLQLPCSEVVVSLCQIPENSDSGKQIKPCLLANGCLDFDSLRLDIMQPLQLNSITPLQLGNFIHLCNYGRLLLNAYY